MDRTDGENGHAFTISLQTDQGPQVRIHCAAPRDEKKPVSMCRGGRGCPPQSACAHCKGLCDPKHAVTWSCGRVICHAPSSCMDGDHAPHMAKCHGYWLAVYDAFSRGADVMRLPLYPPTIAESKRKRFCNGCYAQDVSTQRCSRCRITQYCSVSCQRKDWGRHKKNVCGRQTRNMLAEQACSMVENVWGGASETKTTTTIVGWDVMVGDKVVSTGHQTKRAAQMAAVKFTREHKGQACIVRPIMNVCLRRRQPPIKTPPPGPSNDPRED